MKKKRFVKSMISLFTAFVMGITTFAAGVPGDLHVVNAETAKVQNQDEIALEDINVAAEAVGLVADSEEEGVYYNSNSSMTDFRDETIYFVITTRFYDGDSSNNVQCWEAQDLNVNDPPWRGDFKGLIEKLDYIKALGFTAVWITPVVENASGYDFHGYHAINFSKVDPRYESDGCTYEDLIAAVHEKGMKIIQDVVFNHTGNWGESNLYPIASKDYSKDLSDCEASMVLNKEYGWEDAAKKYGNSYVDLIPKNQFNVREDLLMDGTYETKDIYRHNRYIQGWESYQEQTTSIAGDCIDLNTENPAVYHYLVDTYSEYIRMGVDAFRVDTVKHISRLTYNKALIAGLNEAYNETHGTTGEGNFYMFGEVCTRVRQVWNRDIPALSCPFYTWKENKEYAWNDSETSEATATNEQSAKQAYEDNSSMGSQPTSDNAKLNGNEYHTPDYSKASGLNVIDFPMHWNFASARDAFGVAVGNDQYYNDATFNVMYVDSHDYAPDGAPENQRFAGSTEQWAENLSLMFTFRGIPCIYYGSEIEFQKRKTIDPGPTMALKDTGRAYFGDHIEGSVNTTDFARYNGATGVMAETLNNPLALHIQRLNRLRICIPALRKGQYSTEGCNGGMSFKRRYTDADTDSFVLVAITENATFTGIPNGKYVDAITGDEKTVGDGTLATSGIKGQGDLRVYVLDTGDKTPFLGMIDGKSSFMSGGTDSVAAKSPVEREHGGPETVPATGVTLDITSKTLDLGEKVKLTATVTPSDATNKKVSWATSDNTVATVSGGTVTAVGEGTADITAKTSNGLTAVAAITVEAKGIKVESVTINKTTAALDAGKTLQLNASVSPENADERYAALTWKSSDANVAKVDNTGMVTAMKEGTATITVSAAYGPSATAKIKVNGPKFNYIDGDAVYFEKPANWGKTINVYLWVDGGWKNAEWPGEAMQLLDEGSGIYGFKWPEGKTDSGMKVIFNDNGNQTDDLAATLNGYYNSSGLVKIIDPYLEPEKISVSFVNSGARYIYDGTAKMPEVIVKNGEEVLTENTDYTVSYENNVNAGDDSSNNAPSVIISGMGSYADAEGINTKLTFTIDKAEIPANAPEDMTVSTGNLSEVAELNGGWSWSDEDKVKEVKAGETISVTAVYNGNDKDNYKNISVTVNVKGTDCRHEDTAKREIRGRIEATCGKDGYSGDTYCTTCGGIVQKGDIINATGNHSWNSGVCTVCGEKQQEDCKHSNTKVAGAKEATCTETGYTGDTVCMACGKVVAAGTVVPAKGHNWSSGVCTVCGAKQDNVTIDVTVVEADIVYDGKAKTPQVIVKAGEELLTKDIDYTVSYKNNINAGEALAVVTCKGDYTGTVEKTFTIAKASVPASGVPGTEINAPKSVEKVSDIELPLGWKWSDEDSGKKLETGVSVTATAVYEGTDKNNYETVKVLVKITKGNCEHPFDKIKLKNERAATCTQKGYTGDRCCKVCGIVVTSGREIPALGHSWDNGRVTKEPTSTQKGVRTFTCTRCSVIRTEEIPAKGGGSSQNTSETPVTPITPGSNQNVTITTDKTVKKGTVVTDSASKATYKVTGTASKTAEYVVSGSNAKVLTIPDKIVVNNSTYKVTSVASEAFEGNTKVTGVVIGKNVKTIGKKAFSGCKNLKKVSVSSNVSTIGDNAFYKCTKLTSITIPAKVSKIGRKAFCGCKSLKKITIKTTKLTSKKVGSSAFKGINSKATIKVPKKKLNSYKKILKSKGVGSKVKIKK